MLPRCKLSNVFRCAFIKSLSTSWREERILNTEQRHSVIFNRSVFHLSRIQFAFLQCQQIQTLRSKARHVSSVIAHSLLTAFCLLLSIRVFAWAAVFLRDSPMIHGWQNVGAINIVGRTAHRIRLVKRFAKNNIWVVCWCVRCARRRRQGGNCVEHERSRILFLKSRLTIAHSHYVPHFFWGNLWYSIVSTFSKIRRTKMTTPPRKFV